MTVGKGKRPRDPNQLAKWVVDQSTGQQETTEPESSNPLSPPASPASISQYMAEIGRKGGRISGRNRMKNLSKNERRRIAAKAAKARWKRPR